MRAAALLLAVTLATPLDADTTNLTCVVKAGRNVNARDIALNCGVGEQEVQEILTILRRIEGDAKAQKQQLDRMEAILAAIPKHSISDLALVELARRISADVTDAETAFFELRKAVDIAAGVQQQARDYPGTDAFVAEVLRQVAKLNDAALLDDAGAELDRALALIGAEEANLRARKLTLLQSALKQDILRRDVQAAASRHFALIELQQGRPATISQIREVTIDNWKYARRFGGQFELELAIALTDLAIEIAGGAADTSMLQNDNGLFWRLMGTRGHAADGFAKSVTAYRAALTVRTRGEHPVDWAMTQNNLGAALQQQGSRSAGPEGAALLAEAVTAYRAALSVRTRGEHPVDWAMTQENIGIAELALADHEATADPAPHLRAALGHVEAALTVFDPEHMPYDHGTATALRDHLRARLAKPD